MNIEELKYFVEAAKEQNLSRAAQTLGITQSTLSHAIRRLETEFGLTFFQKQGKAVALTSHGKNFAERAGQLLVDVRNFKQDMAHSKTPILGHYRVGAAQGAAVRMMALAWNKLNLHRQAVLELSSLRSAEILKNVASRKLEFGICFCPQPYPGIKAETFAESESVAMVRANHPILKQHLKERVGHLPVYSLVTPKSLPGIDSCSSYPIFKLLKKPAEVRYYYDSYDAAMDLLSSSDAWAILPKAVIHARKKEFTFINEKAL